MMKRILILFILGALMVSCEKVIDIDLNSSDPHIVIEGIVSNGDQGVFVKITNTTNYFEPGQTPAVSGAKVSISDNLGTYEQLSETEPGLYEAMVIKGVEGRSYQLKVEIEGELFEAESKMSDIVNIDSLTVESYIFSGGPPGSSDTTYILTSHFIDPIQSEDNYRIKLVRNDTVLDFFYLFDDEYNNGDTIPYGTFGNFSSGDSVEVLLYNFEKELYKYYNSLNEVINASPMSSAAPKNPITNISNNAIGYFAALAVDSKRTIIEWSR